MVMHKGRVLGKVIGKNEIGERCKGVYCIDLGESFPTSIWLQKSASIQPRTSLPKFQGRVSFSESFTSVSYLARLQTSKFSIGAANVRRLKSELNIELNLPPNFEALVLGCIDADFCK